VKNCIVSARRRTRSANLARPCNQWLLALLLCTACGARTAFENNDSLGPTGKPGDGGSGAAASSSAGADSGGQPTRQASWDQITWIDVFDQSVAYLWTGSPTNTWALTSAGVGSFFRDHWDGVHWTRTVGERDQSSRFGSEQVWGAQGRQAFAGSSESLQRWSGHAWSHWYATAPGCSAIGGSAIDDIWCANENELWRFDGSQWHYQLMSGIHGIQAGARNDVWIWGTNGASHFDGARFRLELAGLVRQVSASEPTNVWAVQDGDVLHSDGAGTEWTRQNPTGSQVAAVWSESLTNTWIVGAGAVMRWNGSTWSIVPLPAQDEWLLISGSSEDVWIAGTLRLIHGRPTWK
jgi:hypothetical protein